jgi:hypothetical protein
LMNSPFVIEQAKHFVSRPDVASLPKTEERIERMYRLAFGRVADPEEISSGLQFLKTAGTVQTKADRKSVKLTAWEQYAQVLLLANEFAFVD